MTRQKKLIQNDMICVYFLWVCYFLLIHFTLNVNKVTVSLRIRKYFTSELII